MRKIKTIVHSDATKFDLEVNKYLEEGYRVLTASSSSFDGENSWTITLTAILYFDEVKK
jgi:hypothetical protein